MPQAHGRYVPCVLRFNCQILLSVSNCLPVYYINLKYNEYEKTNPFDCSADNSRDNECT